ncbi:MAG: hypothetical protein JWQ29_1889 [Phenylobacterium sp.]|nr:hypothetical protein [Phenylobacterium sp.]
MSDPADMAERHGRILTRLAELGLSLAEELHAGALAAETPKAAGDLVLAFHRVSRSVRQTLALEAKLERDRRLGEREARAEGVREAQARVARRKAQLGAVVERACWTEVEGDEAERLVDHLGDLLDEDALSDDFLERSFDDQVAQLRRDLGLSPSADPGEGLEAEADPERPDRRSSG